MHNSINSCVKNMDTPNTVFNEIYDCFECFIKKSNNDNSADFFFKSLIQKYFAERSISENEKLLEDILLLYSKSKVEHVNIQACNNISQNNSSQFESTDHCYYAEQENFPNEATAMNMQRPAFHNHGIADRNLSSIALRSWRVCTLKLALTIISLLTLVALLAYNIVAGVIDKAEFWSFVEKYNAQETNMLLQEANNSRCRTDCLANVLHIAKVRNLNMLHDQYNLTNLRDSS